LSLYRLLHVGGAITGTSSTFSSNGLIIISGQYRPHRSFVARRSDPAPLTYQDGVFRIQSPEDSPLFNPGTATQVHRRQRYYGSRRAVNEYHQNIFTASYKGGGRRWEVQLILAWTEGVPLASKDRSGDF